MNSIPYQQLPKDTIFSTRRSSLHVLSTSNSVWVHFLSPHGYTSLLPAGTLTSTPTASPPAVTGRSLEAEPSRLRAASGFSSPSTSWPISTATESRSTVIIGFSQSIATTSRGSAARQWRRGAARAAASTPTARGPSATRWGPTAGGASSRSELQSRAISFARSGSGRNKAPSGFRRAHRRSHDGCFTYVFHRRGLTGGAQPVVPSAFSYSAVSLSPIPAISSALTSPASSTLIAAVSSTLIPAVSQQPFCPFSPWSFQATPH